MLDMILGMIYVCFMYGMCLFLLLTHSKPRFIGYGISAAAAKK